MSKVKVELTWELLPGHHPQAASQQCLLNPPPKNQALLPQSSNKLKNILINRLNNVVCVLYLNSFVSYHIVCNVDDHEAVQTSWRTHQGIMLNSPQPAAPLLPTTASPIPNKYFLLPDDKTIVLRDFFSSEFSLHQRNTNFLIVGAISEKRSASASSLTSSDFCLFRIMCCLI